MDITARFFGNNPLRMRLIVQIYEEYVYSPKKIRYGLHKIRFLHFSKVFLAKNVHFSKFFDFCKGKNIIGKMQNKAQKIASH